MKKFFFLLLIGPVICLFSFFNIPVRPSVSTYVKSFIGYINQQPVFDAFAEKKLYILKGKLKLLRRYPANYFVLAVRDQYICFNERKKSGIYLVISNNGKEKKYHVAGDFAAIIDKDGTVYYSTYNDANPIKSISMDGEIKDIGVEGTSIGITDESLYYLKHRPQTLFDMMRESIRPTIADIYKMDLKKRGILKIATTATWARTVILPGDKLIYALVKADSSNKYVPAIFNIDEQKYVSIPVTGKFLFYAPCYSYQKNCLVFYDSDANDIFEVDIPKTFDITWKFPADTATRKNAPH